MRIETLYDQGTAEHAEDALIVDLNLGIFGVADGVSGLYAEKPVLFNGLTGGQFACQCLQATVTCSAIKDLLLNVVLNANELIRKETVAIPPEKVELLPGATLAIVKIYENKVELVQAGDAFALILLKNSACFVTQNQMFEYDMKNREIIAGLMEKHKGNRVKMWKEFGPILARRRRKHINKLPNGYALLNGQFDFRNFLYFTVIHEKPELIILFTDGFVPYPETGDPEVLRRNIFRLYREGGLKAILDNTRKKEEKEKKTSHIDRGEATAMAISF